MRPGGGRLDDGLHRTPKQVLAPTARSDQRPFEDEQSRGGGIDPSHRDRLLLVVHEINDSLRSPFLLTESAQLMKTQQRCFMLAASLRDRAPSRGKISSRLLRVQPALQPLHRAKFALAAQALEVSGDVGVADAQRRRVVERLPEFD